MIILGILCTILLAVSVGLGVALYFSERGKRETVAMLTAMTDQRGRDTIAQLQAYDDGAKRVETMAKMAMDDVKYAFQESHNRTTSTYSNVLGQLQQVVDSRMVPDAVFEPKVPIMVERGGKPQDNPEYDDMMDQMVKYS